MIAIFIILALQVLGLIMATINHGKPKENWDAYAQFTAVIIELILYYYAGLFDRFLN